MSLPKIDAMLTARWTEEKSTSVATTYDEYRSLTRSSESHHPDAPSFEEWTKISRGSMKATIDDDLRETFQNVTAASAWEQSRLARLRSQRLRTQEPVPDRA